MTAMNIIYAIAKDPGYPQYDFPGGDGKYALEDTCHLIRTVRIPRNTSASGVVDLIKKKIGERSKINILRLCAHGLGGKLFLGGGKRGLDMNDAREYFEDLRPYFASVTERREIKIHACYLASDTWFTCKGSPKELEEYGYSWNTCYADGVFQGKPDQSWGGDGYLFCQGLADATGATVHAGIDLIHFKGDYDFRFRGATVYAYPSRPSTPDNPEPKVQGLRLDYDDNGNFVEGRADRPFVPGWHDRK